MKCLTWNIEWATAASARGKRIKQQIADTNPDLICFTEATLDMVPANGSIITSDPDYGYPNNGDRRKVILWSRQSWADVDSIGSRDLPSGRFVTGISHGIRFVGICIPWHDAHVRTGRKDRSPWEDHLQYLAAFAPLVETYCNAAGPVCVTGDFNQRIPRERQPIKAAQRLALILEAGLQVATAGIRDREGKQLIDHVATSKHLFAHVEQIIPKKLAPGLPLSDHVGIVTTITNITTLD